MRKTVLFIFTSLLLSISVNSQTVYDIEAGGGPGGPTPYYAPQFITIEVGDIVRWTNSGGTHNVDGSLETFPDNPEGFLNGQPSSSLWEFEHTFNIVGVYDFECAAFDHNEFQFGTITVVEGSVGIEEYQESTIDIYPNPSTDIMTVSIDRPILSLRVMNLEMKEVQRYSVSGLERLETIDVSSLDKSSYLLEVSTASGSVYRRFVKD
jgi:plastocyanin